MSKKTKMTPKQKLKVITPRLKRGDFANLSKITGYDPSHVRRVLIGESNPNVSIVNEAYKRFSKRKTTVSK